MTVPRAPLGTRGIAARLDDLRLKQVIKIRLKDGEVPVSMCLDDLIAEAELSVAAGRSSVYEQAGRR